MTPTQENVENESTGNAISFDDKTQIKTSKLVFDLDSKEYVQVVKIAPKRTVSSMQEFVSLMNNDAEAILAIVNDGLEEYDKRKLSTDSSVPAYSEEEDGTLQPFTGTALSEDKSKNLGALIIQFAKMFFKYAKAMDADPIKNRAAKKAAKDQALDMILSNPAAVEMLKQ